MSQVKQMVDTKIAGKRVVVFSKAGCPFCTMAKDAFKKYLGKELPEDEYEVVEIARHPDCAAIQTYLQKLTGGKTVPRVFIKGKFLGGGSETRDADASGRLRTMVSA